MGNDKRNGSVKTSMGRGMLAGIAVAGLSLAALTGCVPEGGYTPEQLINPDTTDLNANAESNKNGNDANDAGTESENEHGNSNEDAADASDGNANGNEAKAAKGKDGKRFTVTRESINGTDISVLTDTETGVQYLMTDNYKGTALTPLLDANGNLLVDKDAGTSEDESESENENGNESGSKKTDDASSNSSASKDGNAKGSKA